MEVYNNACRGYYRCSTSKGCSAKKQVERCKTDASKLIITYTSTHNHPGPDLSLLANSATQLTQSHPTTPNQEQEQESETTTDEIEIPSTNCQHSPQLSPLNTTSDSAIVSQEIHQTPGVHCSSGECVGLLKSEENDFYDELEELPTSSFFTAFMKNSFCESILKV